MQHRYISLQKKVFIMLAANVLAFAGLLCAEYASPHAVTEDGSLTSVAYTITAGDEQTILVKDAETAEKVAKEVITSYVPDGCKVEKVKTNKKLSIRRAEIKKSKTPEKVLTAKQAESEIIAQNKTDDPYFEVQVEGTADKVEKIKPEVVKEETLALEKGKTEVKQEGAEGSKIVTEEQTIVNGEIEEATVKSETVTKEAEDKVVKVGTREEWPIIAVKDETIPAEVLGENGSGQTIADFAVQFVGNPYKWGGTSLTEGADCSGFIYAVYQNFGIEIPRTGAEEVGKKVSLKEALPGDIVEYPGHYSLYIGGGKAVHARSEKLGICITSVHASGKIKSITRIIE